MVRSVDGPRAPQFSSSPCGKLISCAHSTKRSSVPLSRTLTHTYTHTLSSFFSPPLLVSSFSHPHFRCVCVRLLSRSFHDASTIPRLPMRLIFFPLQFFTSLSPHHCCVCVCVILSLSSHYHTAAVALLLHTTIVCL